LIAIGIFIWQGLVNLKLGLVLGGIMFIGAIIGAKLTLKLNNTILRSLFTGVVLLLAVKAWLYDIIWSILIK
jgi:uncharacterized protein